MRVYAVYFLAFLALLAPDPRLRFGGPASGGLGRFVSGSSGRCGDRCCSGGPGWRGNLCGRSPGCFGRIVPSWGHLLMGPLGLCRLPFPPARRPEPHRSLTRARCP